MPLAVVGGSPAVRRDFEAMENRRKRAARMFGRGVPQADVARQSLVQLGHGIDQEFHYWKDVINRIAPAWANPLATSPL